MTDYYVNVLKRNDVPAAPKISGTVAFRFHDKTRDKFLQQLEEALKARNWTRPIKTQSAMQAELQQQAKPAGFRAAGIAGYMRGKEQETNYN